MFNEIAIVALSSAIAILLAISIFAGNSKDKLTFKIALIMICTGVTASILSWSYLKDETPIKLIVRSVISITFVSTVLSKLIGRIITAAVSIPKERLQKLMIDYTRKKMGLPEDNDKTTKDNISD